MGGYSNKSLTEKLGIKPKMKVVVLGAPENYLHEVSWVDKLSKDADLVQYFTKSLTDLKKKFPALKASIKRDGILWISWPKKSSKAETDLDENLIMQIGLKNGLVDVKVIAIDKVFSGLKFVYRLKDRA